MKSEKQFVKIFKTIGAGAEEVSSISLKKGQSICKVDETGAETKAVFRVRSNSGMPHSGPEFRGDFLKSDKQVCIIFDRGKEEEEQVAVIHLDGDQHLVKVSDARG